MKTQFSLKEVFNDMECVKLPKSLTPLDSVKEEAKVFRLLMGTTDVLNNATGEKIKQRINYSILGTSSVNSFSKKLFNRPFYESSDLTNLDQYFRDSNPKNINLFKDLLSELCFYFYFRAKGTNTLSLLYIYRILERISYTFPMLYAAKATDYMGTFGKLQAYFKNSSSELKFFNLFVLDCFDPEYLDYKVKINITARNEQVQSSYYNLIRSLCLSNDPAIEIIDCNEATDITIRNRDTLNLLIHIRNRYFHFASGGQRNIRSSELIEPDHFFGLFLDHFLNWISVIYFQLIKNQLR